MIMSRYRTMSMINIADAILTINTIEKRIVYLEKLLKKQNRNNSCIKDIEDYKNSYSLVSFYIDKNIKAIEEINCFIEKNIFNGIHNNDMAEELTYSIQYNLKTVSNIKYKYYIGYMLSAQSILLHRYTELTPEQAKYVFTWYEEYIDNESDTYIQCPYYYIKLYNKFEWLYNKCDEHHILNKNKFLIDKCITLYNNKEFFMVSIIVPILIEGIINDVCSMYDEDKQKIYKSGLSEKIDFIIKKQKKDDYQHYIFSLEYFRYFFPSIRNHMAHGWGNNSKEIEVLAGHLMLDLIAVGELVLKANYKMNIHLERLNSISKCKLDKNSIINYLQFIDEELKGISCDDFYCKNAIIKKLMDFYISNEFKKLVISYITSDKSYFESLCHLLSSILSLSKMQKLQHYTLSSLSILNGIRRRFKYETKRSHELIEKIRNKLCKTHTNS